MPFMRALTYLGRPIIDEDDDFEDDDFYEDEDDEIPEGEEYYGNDEPIIDS